MLLLLDGSSDDGLWVKGSNCDAMVSGGGLEWFLIHSLGMKMV